MKITLTSPMEHPAKQPADQPSLRTVASEPRAIADTSTAAAPELPPLVPAGQLWLLGLAAAAILGVLGVLLFGHAPQQATQSKIAWLHAVKPEEVAGVGDRPTLVFFTADWCAPCKILKQHALADDQVVAAITSGFTPIKVDLTNQNGPEQLVARNWKIDGIPTLIQIDRDGKEVARLVGGVDASELKAWLGKSAR